jgi:hypothetical protein
VCVISIKNTNPIQGQCSGSSIGNEVKTWIENNKPLVIGLASGIGGLIVLSILSCCWRSYKRRRRGKVYAANAAFATPAPTYLPPGNQGRLHRPRPSGRRAVQSPTGSAPLVPNAQNNPEQWRGGDIPQPPAPMYQRTNSVRYA